MLSLSHYYFQTNKEIIIEIIWVILVQNGSHEGGVAYVGTEEYASLKLFEIALG